MINNWNLTGLILEGVSGTGKSTLLKEILLSEQYLKRSGFSSVVLSEHQTQRVLETKDREIGLTLNDNLSLLNLHVKY